MQVSLHDGWLEVIVAYYTAGDNVFYGICNAFGNLHKISKNINKINKKLYCKISINKIYVK